MTDCEETLALTRADLAEYGLRDDESIVDFVKRLIATLGVKEDI
jgi:hypothetical protein